MLIEFSKDFQKHFDPLFIEFLNFLFLHKIERCIINKELKIHLNVITVE